MSGAALLAPALLLAVGSGYSAMLGLGRYGGMAGIPPLAFSFGHVGGGAVALLVLCALRRRLPPLDRRHLRFYVIAGTLGSALPMGLMFVLVHQLGASLTGLLFPLSPIITYAIAIGGRIEPFDRVRAAGIGLGVIGAALIVLPRAALPATIDPVWMLIGLLLPASLAFGNVYRSWDWPAGTDGTTLVTGVLIASSATLLPLILATDQFYLPLPPRSGADLALAGITLVSGVYFVLFFELQRIGGGVYISQLSHVIAICSLAIGYLAFDERLSAWVWAAVVVVAAGVLLVNSRRRVVDARPPSRVRTEDADQRH